MIAFAEEPEAEAQEGEHEPSVEAPDGEAVEQTLSTVPACRLYARTSLHAHL
jgi:hypothetical protein